MSSSSQGEHADEQPEAIQRKGSKNKKNQGSSSSDVEGFEFEVHGKLHSVFSRCTKKTGQMLRLRGWVQNTPDGTVRGQAVGTSKEDLDDMRYYLSHGYDDQDRIDHVDFTSMTQLESEELMATAQDKDFVLRKTTTTEPSAEQS